MTVTMNAAEIPIEELLPHADRMILVDSLQSADQDSAVARVTVRNGGLFQGPDNEVPAWVGIEYMAQTVAAWAGFQGKQANEAPKLGFLLGSRRYNSKIPVFSCGEELEVRVEKMVQGDNGLASFQCRIFRLADDAEPIIEASLNVFQPDAEQAKELMEL